MFENQSYELEVLAFILHRSSDILPACGRYLVYLIQNPHNKMILLKIQAVFDVIKRPPSKAVLLAKLQEDNDIKNSLDVMLSDIESRVEKIYSYTYNDVASVEATLIPAIQKKIMEAQIDTIQLDDITEGRAKLRKNLDLMDSLTKSDDIGLDILKDLATPDDNSEDKEGVVSTPWGQLNAMLQFGGFNPGDLVIFAADRIKSLAMIQLTATAAMLHGMFVLYYTMELYEQQIKIRLRMNILGKKDSEVFPISDSDRLLFKEKLVQNGGQILAKFFPSKSHTVEDLRNHLYKVSDKIRHPDMVIVDYSDLLVVSEKVDSRIGLILIMEKLKGLAGEFNCPIITPTQLKGDTVEKLLLGKRDRVFKTDLAEAKGKINPADQVITISFCPGEFEAKKCRMALVKNRTGPESNNPIYMQFDNYKMRLFEGSPYKEDEEHRLA